MPPTVAVGRPVAMADTAAAAIRVTEAGAGVGAGPAARAFQSLREAPRW